MSLKIVIHQRERLAPKPETAIGKLFTNPERWTNNGAYRLGTGLFLSVKVKESIRITGAFLLQLVQEPCLFLA